jgi:hypothetical protein
VDGHSYPYVIPETATVAGGESFCRHHWLTSQTSVPVELEFVTDKGGAGVEITVSYFKSADYSMVVDTVPSTGIPIGVTVEDTGEWIQWTFNYFAHHEPGNVVDKLAAAVVISYNGETPAFQVHNNDGVTPGYDVGTWLYCPYIDGWWTVGNHDYNTPVADIGWIDATTTPGDGKIVVQISKAKLCATFHWAVYAAIRSGGDLPYTMSVYPEGFNWVTGFESATILEPIDAQFTLVGGERLDFYICYKFAEDIQGGTYYIYTTVYPA